MPPHNNVPMLLLALTGIAPIAAQEIGWQAGVAVESITPEPATGQWLAGLGDPEDKRISEGAHDPIWARALALSDGQTTVVLVICDVVGLFWNEIETIRTLVPDVPADHILIGATHVHSAPDTLGLWGPADDRSGVDPAFLALVRERSAKAARDAVAALEPVTLRLALATSPPRTSMNHNDAGIKDDEIPILQALKPDGAVLATLVNWACHPEVLWTENRLITSDYVHYLREEIEGSQGGTALCFNGALGGMVSPDDQDRHTFAEAERIGRAVGAAVTAAIAEAEVVEPAPIRVVRRVFTMPVDNPGLAALLGAGVLDRGPDAPANAVRTEVAALRIGPSAWVTMPGEALPAVGFLAKSMVDTRYRFLLGLTGDELGYILPKHAADLRKYRYERSMSVNPEAAPMILSELRRALDAIDPER